MTRPTLASLRALPFAIAAAVALWAAPASAVPIRVRGAAVLRGHMRFDDDGWLELRGQLGDEARMPIERGRVQVLLRDKLDASGATSCPRPRVAVARQAGGRQLLVRTSGVGEFCVRWPMAPDHGTVRLHFAGDPYHGSAELDVSFDRAAQQKLLTAVRFDPRPTVLDVDGRSVVLSGVLTVRPASAHVARRGLVVELQDREGKRLGRSRTSGDGKIHFEPPAAALGEPGHAQLSMHFAGSAELTGAQDMLPVTLRALVPMHLSGSVEAVQPGEPARLSVRLEPRRGRVLDGVVEARVAGRSVGSAPVREGQATVSVTLEGAGASQATVELRYLPSSPWWRAGPPLSVVVPFAPPSLVGRVVWSLIVLAAALWTLQSWRRSRRPSRARRAEPAALVPGVHVVRSTPRGNAWRGTVVDAHDGRHLTGATLSVRQPTLDREAEDDALVVECDSDDDGRFAFELPERPRAAELTVRYEGYSTVHKELPGPGTLRVALATHRRSVLRRFVTWTRHQGVPFFAPPEPTPAHVRQAARGEPTVTQWAAAVEQVAFGPSEVDEVAEQRLRDLEPRHSSPAGPPQGAARVAVPEADATDGPHHRGGTD